MILAAALLLQVLPAPAAADGWRVVRDDAEGELRVDAAGVRREGNFASALFRVRLREVRDPGTAPLSMSRIRFDCAARTAGFQTGEIYDANGRLLGARAIEADEVQMSPIERGSVEEMILSIACGGAAQ